MTWRFVVLRATRWVPTGLVIPVLVLLLIGRGLSLTQIGVAMAVQGLVVLVLELPTGGLADAVGRKRVLLAASVVEVAALLLLVVAESLPLVMVVFVLQGVYRALESGPLDAWYVDAATARSESFDRGLAWGGAAVGLAIAAGAGLSGGLIALASDLDNPLVVPLIVAVVLRLVDLGAIASLMTEPERARPSHTGVLDQARNVPSVVAEAVGVIRRSRVLAGLMVVEFCWGFGLTAYESLPPARLGELVEGAGEAAARFGPTVTVAWLAFAGLAAWVPRLTDRIGHAPAAMLLHMVLAASIVGLALAGTPLVLQVVYVMTFGLHGALGPVYQSLLHAHADADHRATIVSAASMAAHPGGGLGGIVLGRVADIASLPTAMTIGAVVIAGAAVFYWPALRQQHRPELGAGSGT